jgi:formate/nitrite transporter FocA (FNT family)
VSSKQRLATQLLLPSHQHCSASAFLQISADDRHENPGLFNLLFGAYGFPVGLSMCVINGASLFTSNIAYMMASFMERKSTAWQSLRVVWLSYFSNLVGRWLCPVTLVAVPTRSPLGPLQLLAVSLQLMAAQSPFQSVYFTLPVNTH